MKPDHERIWLQPGAGDCGGTTWCQDRIHDDDIEYIRADIHARALLEAHKAGMEEAAEIVIKHQPMIAEGRNIRASHAGDYAAAIRAKAQEVNL